MEVKMMKVDDLKPYDRNPRIITELAITQVANSIQKYGFRQPLVVDAEGVIIVGHTRLEAAKVLGIKEVPVHTAEDLSEDELRAYRIADNKVGEYSDWENGVLAEEIEALMERDFELMDFGMNDDDLSFLVSNTFSPETNPVGQNLGEGTQVAEGDVTNAQQKLDGIIEKSGEEDLVGLICPECGYEYHIDPKNLEV